MRILIATDGSECSDLAISRIAERPWPSASEFKVITVLEIPITVAPETWILPEGYYEEIEKAAQAQGREALERGVARLKAGLGEGFDISSQIVTGIPKSAIVDEAEHWHADLIVVGSHGYRAFERFLLGSVSQSVAQHSKCSVEIVRAPANDA